MIIMKTISQCMIVMKRFAFLNCEYVLRRFYTNLNWSVQKRTPSRAHLTSLFAQCTSFCTQIGSRQEGTKLIVAKGIEFWLQPPFLLHLSTLVYYFEHNVKLVTCKKKLKVILIESHIKIVNIILYINLGFIYVVSSHNWIVSNRENAKDMNWRYHIFNHVEM